MTEYDEVINITKLSGINYKTEVNKKTSFHLPFTDRLLLSTRILKKLLQVKMGSNSHAQLYTRKFFISSSLFLTEPKCNPVICELITYYLNRAGINLSLFKNKKFHK